MNTFRLMMGSPMNEVACLERSLLPRMMLERCKIPSTTCVWSIILVNTSLTAL